MASSTVDIMSLLLDCTEGSVHFIFLWSRVPERGGRAVWSRVPERGVIAVWSRVPEGGVIAVWSRVPERGVIAVWSRVPERGVKSNGIVYSRHHVTITRMH